MSPAGGLLGRDEQLGELARLLEGERLITLTGAPGIGKSRLAVELAGRAGKDLGGGARVVELAPVTRPVDVPRALASALSLDERPGQCPTDTLIAGISGRPALLVLDNCEHLLGAARKLVEALLAGCPKLRVIATSREPLGVGAETVWAVPGLALPSPGKDMPPEELAGSPAVALFTERARAAQPGFALSAYVAPAVAEICRRLDGIPLAIELAAARVESLTPEEVARRLDDRFDLLTTGGPDAAAHHHTLAAALDWSHELLSDAERVLLRRLSVFAGGFCLEAAEAVCVGGEVEAAQVRHLLAQLVSRSLVVAEGAAAPRHRLLETIRAYAGERLERSGEGAVLRDSHARCYLALAEEAEPELTGPAQGRWLARLEAERPNLRSAFEWSLSRGEAEQALGLAGALVLFWRMSCHFSEGRELLDAAIAASDGAPPGLRAKALWGAGFMALMAGDPDAAIHAVEESLARFRELGDLRGCARALLILGNCKQFQDDPVVPSLLEQSASLAREAGDSWCLAHALAIGGFEHGRREELAAARSLYEECLVVARNAGDRQGVRFGLLGMGLVALRQGDHSAAELIYEEVMAIADELGEAYSKATTLYHLGHLAGERGDYGRSRTLLEQAVALIGEIGCPQAELGPLASLAKLAHLEGDRHRARLLFQEGLALTGGDPRDRVLVLLGIGELTAEEGALPAARRLFEEALELARAHGYGRGTAQALLGLGVLARFEGELTRATTLQMEALGLEVRNGYTAGIATSLEAVAGLAAAGGRYDRAAQLLGAGAAIRDAGGWYRSAWECSRYGADLATVRRALPAEEFEPAFERGAALSIEEAVAEASGGHSGHRSPSEWADLTDRERQVAVLAAEGLSNPEIAERLCITRWTVKSHLSHIFLKLDIAGRTQLARAVWQREQEPTTPGS